MIVIPIKSLQYTEEQEHDDRVKFMGELLYSSEGRTLLAGRVSYDMCISIGARITEETERRKDEYEEAFLNWKNGRTGIAPASKAEVAERR